MFLQKRSIAHVGRLVGPLKAGMGASGSAAVDGSWRCAGYMPGCPYINLLKSTRNKQVPYAANRQPRWHDWHTRQQMYTHARMDVTLLRQGRGLNQP